MKYLIKTACVLAVVWLPGCVEHLGEATNRPVGADEQVPVLPEASYLTQTAVSTDVETRGETALDSALYWSEKYAEAVEKVANLQQENHTLTENNRRQSEQIIKLKREVEQCQKELDESNEMLLAMKEQLGKWRANILGYRDEIRQVQGTQLILLRRILKVLGAEASEDDELAASTDRRKGVLQ